MGLLHWVSVKGMEAGGRRITGGQVQGRRAGWLLARVLDLDGTFDSIRLRFHVQFPKLSLSTLLA